MFVGHAAVALLLLRISQQSHNNTSKNLTDCGCYNSRDNGRCVNVLCSNSSIISIIGALGGSASPYMWIIGGAFDDLLLSVLAVMGIEHSTVDISKKGFMRLTVEYAPYSHGLAWNLVISAVFMAIAIILIFLQRRQSGCCTDANKNSYKLDEKSCACIFPSISFFVSFVGALIALSVALPSHWFCDYIVHYKDLHLGFSDSVPSYGLGLWRINYLGTVIELILVYLAYLSMAEDDRNSWGHRYCKILAIAQVSLEFILQLNVPAPNRLLMHLSLAVGYGALVWIARDGEKKKK